MPANRHRHAQRFPFVYVCIGTAAFLCIASFSVKTLLISQQLKQGGERLSRIKRQIEEVRIANAGLKTKKAQLTSIPAITKAIKDGVVKLVPIEDRFIVHVGTMRHGVAVADPQPATGRGR
jgi:hypothetical protein